MAARHRQITANLELFVDDFNQAPARAIQGSPLNPEYESYSTHIASIWPDIADVVPFLDAQRDVLEKIRSQVPIYGLSLLQMSKLLSNSDDAIILSTRADLQVAQLRERASQKTLPSRLNAHLATTTDSVALLHLAIHELVNSHHKYNKPSTLSRFQTRPLHIISGPVRWVLSYLQNAPRQVFQGIQACIPSPYSEALCRGLFRKALHIRAFQVLEGLLCTSPKAKSLIKSHYGNEYQGDLFHSFFHSGRLELSRLIMRYSDN